MDNINNPTKFLRTTQEQLLFYKEFCRQYPQLLAGKNSLRSSVGVQDLWSEIAENLNALKGPTRTAEKWKENLGVRKSQLRARVRNKNNEQQMTGDGPSSSGMLTDFEERALSTFGVAPIDGVPGIATLGMQTDSEAAISPGAGYPCDNNRGLDSPASENFGASSPVTTMLINMPVGENFAAGLSDPNYFVNSPASSPVATGNFGCNSPTAGKFGGSSPGSPPAINDEISSSSTASLRPSSPASANQGRYSTDMTQQGMFAVILSSIERSDARHEQMIQVQLATLQALEKLATAIESISK